MEGLRELLSTPDVATSSPATITFKNPSGFPGIYGKTEEVQCVQAPGKAFHPDIKIPGEIFREDQAAFQNRQVFNG